jgi:hypothetical protein
MRRWPVEFRSAGRRPWGEEMTAGLGIKSKAAAGARRKLRKSYSDRA